MKLIDGTGDLIDAEFSTILSDGMLSIILESRGGSKGSQGSRNPDYNIALAQLLQRLSTIDADLLSAVVESRATSQLPEQDRLIQIPLPSYPVKLCEIQDFEVLRANLTRPQGQIGRAPGARGPGNMTKRCKLTVGLPGESLTQEDIDEVLRSGVPKEAEKVLRDVTNYIENAADFQRIARLIERRSSAFRHSAPEARERLSKSIERGPIGSWMKAYHEYRCQICTAHGLNTPQFVTRAGHPYVEAHHIIPVASAAKGVLHYLNIIVVCANHHRELHYGESCRVRDEGSLFRIGTELGEASISKVSFGVL